MQIPSNYIMNFNSQLCLCSTYGSANLTEKHKYWLFFRMINLKAYAISIMQFFFFFCHATWYKESQFPHQGWNLCCLWKWKYRLLTTGLPGKFLNYASVESCNHYVNIIFFYYLTKSGLTLKTVTCWLVKNLK